MSRRALLLGGVVVLGGGAGACGPAADGDAPVHGKVRTDLEPLRRRFSAIGRLSDAHWLAYNPDDSGRELLPDQDPRTRLVGTAHLPVGTVGAIVARSGHDFAPSTPVPPPEALAEFLPAGAGWLRSPGYDSAVTRSLYHGTFHLDPVTDVVYFDALNPEIVSGTPTVTPTVPSSVTSSVTSSGTP
ncbi:hypothetical protein [Streptomyces sp. NPDC058664]|uniref:hypothetical protein n=1 Tax=unclassified Streptomyces TaxID=2593676 RepID=UPI0036561432